MSSSSRQNILAAIGKNKPAPTPLPAMPKNRYEAGKLLEKFTSTAVSIGSSVFPVKGYPEISEILHKEFGQAKRIISNVKPISSFPVEMDSSFKAGPHSFENVDLAVLEGGLAVAENSAIWLPEAKMGHRVLPFICQHLALIISVQHIVGDMHEAYEIMEKMEEGYGVFIAGPSKTADIEQSLVLGAHGPRSLSIFILGE